MLERLAVMAEWFERRPRMRLGLFCVLLAPAVWQIGVMAWVVSGRLVFPLQLEWLEGGEIYHAQRLLQGEAIYRRAASGFLPYPYPPLHALMLAGVGALWGLSYASARAVSVGCFVVAAGVLTWRTAVHFRGRARAVGGLLSSGYLGATYPMVHGWYDIARVDTSALVFMILTGAALDRRRIRGADLVLAGVLGSLALYTKQTNVFAVAWVCLLAILRQGKRAWVLPATLSVLCVGAFAWLQWTSDGAFAVWLFDTAHHSLRLSALGRYAWLLVVQTPFLLVLPFGVRRIRARGRLTASSRLWLGMLAAAIPASLLPYVKVGGSDNSLIPLLFLAGPVTLMVAGDALTAGDAGDAGARGASDPRAGEGRSSVSQWPRSVFSGFVLQALLLSLHLYDPRRGRPSAAARREAEAFNRAVAALEGGVICPLDPFLPAVNGNKAQQADWISHVDAMQAKRPGVTVASYTNWLLRERPRWLLLSGFRREAPILPVIEKNYSLSRELPMPSIQKLWLTHPVPVKLYERRDRDAS